MNAIERYKCLVERLATLYFILAKHRHYEQQEQQDMFIVLVYSYLREIREALSFKPEQVRKELGSSRAEVVRALSAPSNFAPSYLIEFDEVEPDKLFSREFYAREGDKRFRKFFRDLGRLATAVNNRVRKVRGILEEEGVIENESKRNGRKPKRKAA